MSEIENVIGLLFAMGCFIVLPAIVVIVALLIIPIAADWWEAWLFNVIAVIWRRG